MRSLPRLSLLLVLVLCGCGGNSEEKSPATGKPEVPQPAATFEPFELTSERVDEGWISLFDGKSKFGWRPSDGKEKDAVNWNIEDGVITADAGGPGLLLTSVPFADFELTLEYRLEQGGNSGVFLRTTSQPTNPAEDCYELNFCDTHEKFGTASLVGRTQPTEEVTADGEWTRVDVVCRGTRITAKFNGKPALDFTDESQHIRRAGFIGLQKNEKKIEFRNLALKPLSLTDVFNGKDLTGWHVVPESKSEFTVQDGAIHVVNGRGFLESDEVWADFVLQAKAITHGEHLNSGIFFRTINGTADAPSNGYEFQIHNGYKEGDATDPLDFGTGGIYRRVKAREVFAKDNEWATLTLVAHGPHIATWVNGRQAVAWTDERPADANPRKGLRTEAGHLSLQGHDPTTNLDFKAIRIAETPAVD